MKPENTKLLEKPFECGYKECELKFQIKQEPGLPSRICETCLKNLSIAHKFKTSCLVAEETFRKLVTPVIKAEQQELIEYEFEEIIECKDEDFDELKQELMESVVEANGVRKRGRVKLKDR